MCVCVHLIAGLHSETKNARVCRYRNKTGSSETRQVSSASARTLQAGSYRILPVELQIKICPLLKMSTAAREGQLTSVALMLSRLTVLDCAL